MANFKPTVKNKSTKTHTLSAARGCPPQPRTPDMTPQYPPPFSNKDTKLGSQPTAKLIEHLYAPTHPHKTQTGANTHSTRTRGRPAL